MKNLILLAMFLSSQAFAAGDVVTLLGKDQGDVVTAEELASLADTIPYEIVTRINPQIPRIVT